MADPAAIELAGPTLVLLMAAHCGAARAFAQSHFRTAEILDLSDSAAEAEWDGIAVSAARLLAAGGVAVIPSGKLDAYRRRQFVAVARSCYATRLAVVLDYPESYLRELAPPVDEVSSTQLAAGIAALRADIPRLSREREGFRKVVVFTHPAAAAAAAVIRGILPCDRQECRGPFDLIGDVHGCFTELTALLSALGYRIAWAPDREAFDSAHPAGRTVVFLGDLADRGPGVCQVFRLAMDMVAIGQALWVPGNHDMRLLRVLQGGKASMNHGLPLTLEQLDREPLEFRLRLIEFLERRVSHYVLDGGALIAVHGGLKEEMHGRNTGAVLAFALYGDATGELDGFGLPIRRDWAADYRGVARVIYGHTPISRPRWINNTINIDTGCVFGGSLTALRYPELELVQVSAGRAYCEPLRPMCD